MSRQTDGGNARVQSKAVARSEQGPVRRIPGFSQQERAAAVIAARDFSGAAAVPECKNRRWIAAPIALMYASLGIGTGATEESAERLDAAGRRRSRPSARPWREADRTAVICAGIRRVVRPGDLDVALVPRSRREADVRQLTQGSPSLARTGGPDSGVGNVVS